MPVADRAAPRTRSSHFCARAIVGTEATATIANAAAYLAVLFGLDGILRLPSVSWRERLLAPDEQVRASGWTLFRRDRLDPGYCFEAKPLSRIQLGPGHQNPSCSWASQIAPSLGRDFPPATERLSCFIDPVQPEQRDYHPSMHSTRLGVLCAAFRRRIQGFVERCKPDFRNSWSGDGQRCCIAT